MNRMLLGYSPDFDIFEDETTTVPMTFEGEGSVLHDDHTEEATALLEVARGPGLPALLARLLQRAAREGGASIAPAVEGELVRLLQRAARVALPASPAQAGRLFGIELEGLSPEDQEFETARRFVQWAEAAARHAAWAPPRLPPAVAASLAAARAARRLAPGLPAALRRPPGAAIQHRSARIAAGGSRPITSQGAHHA